MSSYVSQELRRLVATRADRLCEYCLIHEDDTFFGCEVDHIISLKHGGPTEAENLASLKHGGPTEAENLAYSCMFCNRQKGSDIGSILWRTGELIRFFNPRKDRWADHFRLSGTVIEPITGIGEVTVRIFDFNAGDRILERETLIAVGRYPSSVALQRMQR
jgi:hypothetical protein